MSAAGARRPALCEQPLAATLPECQRVVQAELTTVEVFLNAGYGYDIRCEVVGDRGVIALTNLPAWSPMPAAAAAPPATRLRAPPSPDRRS